MSMAIKTKSVYEGEDKGEGHRLLIMRIWPRGIPKTRFDEWDKELAPSPQLLKKWLNKSIPFEKFRSGYTKEMESQRERIKTLAKRVKKETITLFCHETEDAYCHRKMLKELIQRCKV